jgi:hypothetical protein
MRGSHCCCRSCCLWLCLCGDSHVPLAVSFHLPRSGPQTGKRTGGFRLLEVISQSPPMRGSHCLKSQSQSQSLLTLPLSFPLTSQPFSEGETRWRFDDSMLLSLSSLRWPRSTPSWTCRSCPSFVCCSRRPTAVHTANSMARSP